MRIEINIKIVIINPSLGLSLDIKTERIMPTIKAKTFETTLGIILIVLF